MRNVCRAFIRSCSSNKGKNWETFFTYSTEQQLQIVQTLQNHALNNVTRPYLNEKRLQSLKLLFEQNSNIHNLEPLLNVSGIGPKLLHRICDSILDAVEDSTQYEFDTKTENNDKLKSSHSLITPSFLNHSKVESVISIHLGINAISWSRLWTSGSTEDVVDRWDVMDISEFVERKYDVHSVWDLVLQLRNLVPNGDIYVMENTSWSNVASVKKPMKFHIQEAMITTAICSIFNQSDNAGEPIKELKNRLYFLRTFIPSRLFNKIVGSERVTAQDIVLNMMEGLRDPRHRPIAFSDGTADNYLSVNGSMKDNMCRSLLLAVSFAELLLHQNPDALGVIGNRTVKNKTSR